MEDNSPSTTNVWPAPVTIETSFIKNFLDSLFNFNNYFYLFAQYSKLNLIVIITSSHSYWLK